MNTFILKSRAVFDGISDTYRPMAILIENDRIAELLPYEFDSPSASENSGKYADMPVYDMGDNLIMPSFIDAHTHIFSGAVAASPYVCNTLDICHSESECVDMIVEYAKQHPEQKRIRGMGWFVGGWADDSLPDKRSLDAYFPDTPVYLECADAHSMWLNSAALKEAGIRADANFSGGIIETFPDGELTGMLIEPAAYAPAMEKFMDFTDAEMMEIHRNFNRVLAENGIAGLSEMFADDYTEETFQKYMVLKKLDEQEGLHANVYVYTKLFGYTSFEAFYRMREQLDSRHFHITGLKGFLDGVTETYTGLLLEPYTDCPDTCGENLPLWPKAKMEQEIEAANREGIQVRLHCIADGSVRMALDMYERARKKTGRYDIRNTVEHIENIHPDDIRRFRQLGVIASMQPYHLILSNNDKIVRLGKKRCRYEWPMKSLTEAGAKLALGTDYPVVSLNPFRTIHAAVTRKDSQGAVSGQNPWEALDMATTLRAYTYEAACVYQAERETGSIETGKKANLIVLNQNLFTVHAEEIPNTKVLMTLFEGTVIYNSENANFKNRTGGHEYEKSKGSGNADEL